MFKSDFELRVLRNTPSNIAVLRELGERAPAKEYHLLVNKSKVALVTHYIWETCQYCTYEENEKGHIVL